MLPSAMLKLRVEAIVRSEFALAYLNVLHWFLDYPEKEFTLNEVCRQAGIAKTTGHRVVYRMVKEGFLELQRLGRLWRIKANQNHPYFVSEKIPYHLNLVYRSGIVEAIKSRFNPLAIVLFGSYRKGDDVSDSDLDIAVETIGNEPLKIIELAAVQQFGYRTNVKVNLHVFSRNKIDLNVFANITNGIVLDGFLEARP